MAGASSERTQAIFWSSIAMACSLGLITAVGGICAAPALGGLERSRLARTRADVAQLARGLASVREDTGHRDLACLTVAHAASVTLPAECEPLASASDPRASSWHGPYLAFVQTNDPWERPYRISVESTTGSVTVTSDGPDGLPQTSDDLTASR